MALTKAQLVDMNANELILDLDADTSLHASTDDQIDIKIGGADDFTFTANTFTALAGSSIVTPTLSVTSSATISGGAINLAAIDIDGGTDIGAAVADADLFIIDDGAGGTNRKVTAARVKTYMGAEGGAFSVANLDIDGATDIGAAIVDADLFIIDDGAGGTNRKVAASRIKTYIGSSTAADDLTIGDAAVTLSTSSGNITLDATANDSDIIFKGTDNSSDITMLTLDGSAAGAAIFNSTVTTTGLVIGSTAVTSTPAELNLIDGGATIGTTAVADGDGVLHNDGGTMKVTSAATFKTYFQEGISQAYDDFTIGDAAVLITTSSGNITVDAAANDSDIILKGTDGGVDTTFLTIDGSAAGDATFNNQIIVGDGKLVLGSTAVTSTAAELNILDDATVTTAEINLIDGGTARGTTAVATGDGILINDGGTMRMTNVDTVSTYFAGHNVGGGNIVTTGALDSGSITSGFGAIDNGTSNIRSATITAETAFVPDAANGATLGTASLEFADMYLHDGGIVYFGADQDVELAHVADVGLTLKTATTSDDTKATLTLQTGDTDIAVNDVLGQLHFQAPDEGAGTDAILVAAGIAAISEGDFSASNNATKLSFQTGASEAASEKMSLSSVGLLTIADDLIIKNAGTIGTAADSDLLTMGNAILTVAGEVSMTTLDIGGTNVTSTATELNQLDGVVAKTAGKETIWVPAQAMTPTASNGCSTLQTVETTSGRPDMNVLDFDKDSDEFAQFAVAFPKSYNLGTVTFQFFWSGIAATTGVELTLAGVAMNDNETIDVAYGTAVAVADAAQGAVEELLVSAESGAVTIAGTMADNDLAYFRIGRDVSEDNMAGDCRLHGIKLHFTTDAANDA
jgi:hypothetical protein